MSRRDRIRESALADPASAATVLNDTLMNLYERIEALERTQFLDVEVVSDSGSSVSNIVFARPKWPVRAVYVAKLYDLTAGNVDYLSQSLMWVADETGIHIPIIYFSSAATRYLITFEVRG